MAEPLRNRNASERMDPTRPVYVISVAAELVREEVVGEQTALCLFDDGVDGHEAAEQRFKQVEPERVLRVALRR